ncbi:MAG: shikimate dehydrogenase [Chitinophagaceae bacterium]|nr:shikimate dehydrogenase [Chitinophagaceae bacterium]
MMNTGKIRRFGLLGYPLTHSFSPRYFKEKFEREKLSNHQYDLFPLESIDQFPALLKQFPELEGLNVTIPYKKEVMKFLHDSLIPDGIEACNCISIKDSKLTGYNTDIIGFELSLLPLLRSYHTQALILGSGGAAAAVAYVLKKNQIEYIIVSRRDNDAAILSYASLTKDLIRKYKLIINTTPLGMYPDISSCPPIPYEGITPEHLLYDLVYNPPLTEFLKKGQSFGSTIKNGEEMLILQAEESWKIWNQRY